MLIYSMDFTNSAVFSMDVCVLVDVPVTSKAVVGGTVGAKATTNVEGTTIETVGITV